MYRSFSGRERPKKANVDSLDVAALPNVEFKAVSPKKKKCIFSFLKQRVEKANVSKQCQFERLKMTNIALLVSKGIGNIRISNRRTQ